MVLEQAQHGVVHGFAQHVAVHAVAFGVLGPLADDVLDLDRRIVDQVPAGETDGAGEQRLVGDLRAAALEPVVETQPAHRRHAIGHVDALERSHLARRPLAAMEIAMAAPVPRRRADRLRQLGRRRIVGQGQHVAAADAAGIGEGGEGGVELLDPVGMGHRIVVGHGDELAARVVQRQVERRHHAGPVDLQHLQRQRLRIVRLAHDVLRRRIDVAQHDDDLQRPHGLSRQPVEAAPQLHGPLVGRHDDREGSRARHGERLSTPPPDRSDRAASGRRAGGGYCRPRLALRCAGWTGRRYAASPAPSDGASTHALPTAAPG